MTKISRIESGVGSSTSEQESCGASWLPPATTPTFPTSRVDIWKVCLDIPDTTDRGYSILSSDEVARANRFRFEKDRHHYSHCRSSLRRLLALYLAVPAEHIRFEYLPGGKPQVIAGQNPRALQFNVSHSAGVALIAVGSERPLGVDVEKIRVDIDTTALAERFFSLRERAGLRALPDELRVSGFYACWTRKESILKATGEGLSFPLADFSVTTHPDFDPRLEDIKGDEASGKQWFLADLNVGAGFRATVAVDPTQSRLETYVWS